MRRTDFVNELQRIVAALKIQDLANFLAPYMTASNNAISAEQKKTFAQLFLDSQVGYREVTKDEQTKAILESLDLSRVYSASEILNLLAFFYNSQQVNQIVNHLPFRTFHDFLVRILAIANTCAKFLGENGTEGLPAEPPGAKSKTILDLLVVDF